MVNKVEKELRKLEDELHNSRKNEILLGDLLKYSSQPFGVGYPDGSLGIVNKAFEELTGYTQEELKSSDWSDTLTPPEFHDMEHEKLEKLQRIGQPVKYEKEYIRKDGIRVPIELLVHLVRNEDGSPKFYYSFITDITERKEREMLSDALNKLNSYINSILDYDEIMQLIVEEGAKAVGAESSVINLIEGDNWVVKFAYNFPDNIIGQIKSDLESPTSVYVANEKKAVAFNDAPNDSRVNKNGMRLHGVSSVLVAPIILKDEVKGIIAFYHHQNTVVFSEAQIDFANKLASSLSQAVENAQLFDEIKKSEKHYQQFFDNPLNGFAFCEIITDEIGKPVDFIYLDVNNAFENFTGLKREDVLNKKVTEILPSEDVAEIIKIYGKVALTGESANFEYSIPSLNKYYEIVAFSPERTQFIAFFTDISERKKTEEDLKKSEKSLADAQRIAHIGNWEWNIQTGEIEWSDEIYSIYKLDKDSYVPTLDSFANYVHPDDRELMNNVMDQIISERKSLNFSFRIILDDGSELTLDTIAEITHYDENGNPLIVTGVNYDITERKKAEEIKQALLEKEEKLTTELSTLIENIVDEVWFFDSQGNIKLANAAARKFEQKVELESANLLDDLITGVEVYDGEGNPRPNEGAPPIRALKGEILTNLEEIVVFPRLGETQYRQVSSAPIKNDANEITGAVSVVRDITEQKKSEENIRKLADVVESSNDAIITKSLEGIITSWNKGAEKIYGYEAEEVLGQNISILAPNSLKDEILQLIEKIKQGKRIDHYETLRVKKDESLVNVSITLSPIFDASGKLIAISTIARDITESKKAEEKMQELLEHLQSSEEDLTASNEELRATSEELKTTNDELHLQMDYEVAAKSELEEIAIKLKISNKELEQFAYVASHDLQEPLRMVTSFTQLLERRYKNKLDREADDYIGFIVEGSKRMKYLIDDLLEFSRLNTQVREFESVLLEIALEDVLRNLTASIAENNAQITHDPLPAIMGDPSQINQLLQNLITNAIKFHGDESPKIHISAVESGDEWIIGVSDEGIGIDPEHQEQIFRIFKRLHTREEYEGTGIGLAICKRIVDRHNGKIWVESELGKGSTFYFTIPKT
jgi:PAS domain S-box-containing protein